MKSICRYTIYAAIILIFVLIMGNSLDGNRSIAGETDIFLANDTSENHTEDFIDNQNEACVINGRFFSYLRKMYGITCDDQIFSVNGILAEDFPSYYAGSYINVEGNLVVQISEPYYTSDFRSAEWYHDFAEIVGTENFYCHPVKYSYSELMGAVSEVMFGSISDEFADMDIRIVDAAIDDYHNCVVVHFKSQDEYDAVINRLSSDIYSVSVTEYIPEDN